MRMYFAVLLFVNALMVYSATPPILTGPINVRREFGATGDGTTDDSVKIQAAFDLQSTTEREVYFPPGNYRSGQLRASSNLKISGPAYITIVGTNWLTLSNVINVDIRNLYIMTVATNQVGIRLINDAHDNYFESVFITSSGIWTNRTNWLGNGPYGWYIERSYINTFVNCSSEFVGTEVWFNSDNSHRNSFYGGSYKNANKYNVLATITGHDNSFNGSDIEGPSTFVRLTSAEIDFNNCYFEGHTNHYGIQIDGESIVNINRSYMNTTFIGNAISGGAGSGLVLKENIWDGISSSTNNPFIRYTVDSSTPMSLIRNKSRSAVVIYRSGQWWDGTNWFNLTNDEEEIIDSNLIYDPATNAIRRVNKYGPFLDSVRLRQPIGIGRYPDNALGLALKVTGNPTNLSNTSMLAFENSYVSAGYHSLGIDSSNRLAFRWWPSSNNTIFSLDSDGYAVLPLIATNNLLYTDQYSRIIGTNLSGFVSSTNFASITVSNNLNIGRLYTSATNNVINWNNQQTTYLALTNHTTNTFSNVPTDTNSTRTINVVVNNPSTYTIDWPDTITWPPSDVELNPMTNAITTFVFKWDGTNVLGYADQLVNGGTTINPTDGFFPYRSSSTTFADSPLKRESVSQVSDSYRAADEAGPVFVLVKQGRTGSATNSPASSSQLGVLGFGGWNGTGDIYAQNIRAITTEAWAVGSNGHKLEFYTIANGSSSQARVFTLDQDGSVIPFVSAAPTTASAGAFAFDSNIWGASRGSLQMFDGTGNTIVAAYKTTDPPTTGDVMIFDGSGWTNGPMSSAGGTNALQFGMFQGSGTDYALTTSMAAVTFGGGVAELVLPTAGAVYQITVDFQAQDTGTFSQSYVLTNITDTKIVLGSTNTFIPSGDYRMVSFVGLYTNVNVNSHVQLWGKSSNGSCTNCNVSATNTVMSYIDLSSGSSGPNMVTSSANITDNVLVRGDGGAKGIQGSVITATDLGALTIGDDTQASLTRVTRVTGTDLTETINAGGINIGTAGYTSGSLSAANAASGSITAGSTGVILWSGRAELFSPADRYLRLDNSANTLSAMIGGVLKIDTTTTGNVGAGEDNLITYTVPANCLGVNGEHLEFDVAGTFAATANTKRLKVLFGATILLDTTSLIFNGVDWRVHGRILRTGAATQKATTECTIGGTLLSSVNSTITDYTTPAETLSGTVVFKCTGEDTGGVPADNAVVQEIMVLKWMPNQ